jgi:TolB-like protein
MPTKAGASSEAGGYGSPGETPLSGERVERRLAAILAADVAGYSRLMGRDEAGTLARLKALRRESIDPEIAEHKGRVVKTTGDGLLVEFPSVVEAVACAVAMQRGMSLRNADTAEDQRIEFRVGINSGDVIVEDGDIHGDGVNVTARLQALAEPGGICVSAIVHDQVHGRLDCTFTDIGKQHLKNIARPVQVYRVSSERAAAPTALPALTLPDKPSIAVLAFQNLSGDPKQEYFADGIVEEITTAIARLPWLFVIARNSSFTYKGKAVDVKQVARDLGVRYVLEGSVRKAGNRVRITGQLIDTATAAHIWADRFDGTLDDIFDLQDQVASSVVGAIEPKLRQSEIERATRKPTASLDAYDFHLRALAQSYKRTRESVAEAIQLAHQALQADPAYAPAMALIGAWRLMQRSQGWVQLSEAELAETLRLAQSAIETGRDDPDALSTAGHVLAHIAGEHEVAATAIDRALTLNPNSAAAWRRRGWVQCMLGEPDAAIESLQRALRLSPLDPSSWQMRNWLALAHLAAGRYEDAMEWVDLSLREQPHNHPALRTKVVLCAQLGRITEARDWLSRLLDLEPGLTIAYFQKVAGFRFSPGIMTVYVEGLRKAGLPEG